MSNSHEVVADDYLVSSEVLAILRVSRRTLERYVADGKLRTSKVASGNRRYRRSDVLALIAPASDAPSDDAGAHAISGSPSN